eukprot:6533293-Prymnesium_polylepis.1
MPRRRFCAAAFASAARCLSAVRDRAYVAARAGADRAAGVARHHQPAADPSASRAARRVSRPVQGGRLDPGGRTWAALADGAVAPLPQKPRGARDREDVAHQERAQRAHTAQGARARRRAPGQHQPCVAHAAPAAWLRPVGHSGRGGTACMGFARPSPLLCGSRLTERALRHKTCGRHAPPSPPLALSAQARGKFIRLSNREAEAILPTLIAKQGHNIEKLKQSRQLWWDLTPLERTQCIAQHVARATIAERRQIVRSCVQVCARPAPAPSPDTRQSLRAGGARIGTFDRHHAT